MTRIVCCESPYKSSSAREFQRNLAYCRALCRFVLDRGDVPMASHLDITQVLDDKDPAQREKGIAAGLARLRVADIHLFGIDLGWSSGMEWAKRSTPGRCSVEHVSLPGWPEALKLEAEGNPEPLSTLIAKYQPMWRVHE
jgi:hypothetical protein